MQAHIWFLPGLSFRILETVNFTLQHVIANRHKPGVSVFAELRWQISATPGLPRQQPEPATSESSCKCEDDYQILPCFHNLACYLLEASPRRPQNSQNGDRFPRMWLFCAFSAISVVSLFPAPPTTSSVSEFSGKALYTLQSECLKCFSISNWK